MAETAPPDRAQPSTHRPANGSRREPERPARAVRRSLGFLGPATGVALSGANRCVDRISPPWQWTGKHRAEGAIRVSCPVEVEPKPAWSGGYQADEPARGVAAVPV